MNNEFLKGIEAREKVVQLKKIIKVDSAQLSLYRDTIVPEYQEALTRSENLLIEREEFIISQTKWIKFLSYLSGGLGLITLGLII